MLNYFISKAPGSGQYQAFSEFGIYRSKNADKFEAMTNRKTSEEKN